MLFIFRTICLASPASDASILLEYINNSHDTIDLTEAQITEEDNDSEENDSCEEDDVDGDNSGR